MIQYWPFSFAFQDTNSTLFVLFSELIDRPRSELTELELKTLEEYEFNHGPMSILNNAVKNDSPIIISCRNNHKLIGKVRAFDRHCNLVLENVKELWTEDIKNNKGKKSKVFPRRDSFPKCFKRRFGDNHFKSIKLNSTCIIILHKKEK